MNIKIKVCKINSKAVLPQKDYENLGMDICACLPSDVTKYTILPLDRCIIPTGLKIELPENYGVLLRDRSGLSTKQGIHVLAGVIDPSYRGEWKICLLNTSKYDSYSVAHGDRIAQAIFVPNINLIVEEVSEDLLSNSMRGENGFGSSGR